MRKLKRKKITVDFIEKRIAKNDKRIQIIAYNSYLLRQQLAKLAAMDAAKEEVQDAVCPAEQPQTNG